MNGFLKIILFVLSLFFLSMSAQPTVTILSVSVQPRGPWGSGNRRTAGRHQRDVQ